MRIYERITRHFKDNIVTYGIGVALVCFMPAMINYSEQTKESAEQTEFYFSQLDSIGQARYQNLLESRVDTSLIAPKNSK